MRNLLYGLAASLCILCFSVFGQDDKLARGKYLVEEVARCQDCHTPHLVITGDFVKSAWMKGATLDYVPVNQPPNWHSKTPDITSTSPLWARWGDDGMVKYLETGVNPRGNKPSPPMPAYNLTHDDAVAVAAFLKSLK
jgi:mono/diheme cytochrome c family protein